MRYHNITNCDMVNGTGLRTVLWVAGCEHHCKGCQNPCTWDPNGGIPFDDTAEAELFSYLGNKYIDGITFSGGDPLHPNNRDEIGRLVNKVADSFSDKDIWLYTGYSWDEIVKLNLPWLNKVNVVVEGKFVLDLRDIDLQWRGSSNQAVVDVKMSLSEGTLVPWKEEE